MCNERNDSVCYTTATYKQHFQEQKTLSRTGKKIIKRHFYLPFSLLYLFIHSCKFVVIETYEAYDIAHEAYDIAHDDNVISSLISQRI